MRIGILGGSFNPPHEGHIQAAIFAKMALHLDFLHFLVTPRNPFKSGKNLPPIDVRAKMLQKIATKPWMKTSKIEEKFRVAESFFTVQLLKKLHPNDQIFFILGTDNLLHFHKWKGFEWILGNVNVVFINRGGYNIHKILAKSHLRKEKIEMIFRKTKAISSTQIRKIMH
jgi:nicotinate-nucleotide adenylyltransferase